MPLEARLRRRRLAERAPADAVTLPGWPAGRLFTQLQSRRDLAGRVAIDVVLDQVRGGGVQVAMGALARYGLADAAQRCYV